MPHFLKTNVLHRWQPPIIHSYYLISWTQVRLLGSQGLTCNSFESADVPLGLGFWRGKLAFMQLAFYFFDIVWRSIKITGPVHNFQVFGFLLALVEACQTLGAQRHFLNSRLQAVESDVLLLVDHNSGCWCTETQSALQALHLRVLVEHVLAVAIVDLWFASTVRPIGPAPKRAGLSQLFDAGFGLLPAPFFDDARRGIAPCRSRTFCDPGAISISGSGWTSDTCTSQSPCPRQT